MSPSQTLQHPDYYTVLGADPLAQLDQIEALFRELAIEAETSGDHSKVPQAVEAFKVLRDPQLRQQYDQVLNQQRAQLHQQQMMQGAQPQATQPPQQQVHPTQVQQPVDPQSHTAPPMLPAEQLQQAPVEQLAVSPQPASPTLREPVAESVAEPASDLVATAEPIQAVEEPTEPALPEPTPENKSTPTEELKLKPDVLERHRRELLRMFYEKRRADMRRCGIAIGGLDTIVAYSYELLEFHLWILAEKNWIIREESGAFAISAEGCENHEINLSEGLVQSSMG